MIETTGEGKCAVATSDGKSRKKKSQQKYNTNTLISTGLTLNVK